MTYQKHRILRNPLKWLERVRKRHSESLYCHDRYDPNDLINNPFALALTQTKQDVQLKRFPVGNMVQMIVTKNGVNYDIVPVLEKPTLGHNPANYIINKSIYIDLALNLRSNFLPLKHRMRDKAMYSLASPVPNFLQEITRLYKGAIENSLHSASTPANHHLQVIPQSAKPSSESLWVSFVDNKVQIYCDDVTESVQVPLNQDSRSVAYNLLRLAQFHHRNEGGR